MNLLLSIGFRIIRSFIRLCDAERHWPRHLILLLALTAAIFDGRNACAGTPLDEVFLYRSPLTQAFFRANGASYETLRDRWREYLKRYGSSFHEVTRANLLAGLKPGILVLGSAVLLDEKERAAINAYARAGNSVLATWGTGARDGKGSWTGFDFLEDLFGMKIDGIVKLSEETRFLNSFGDSPLTWSLPAGKRIFLGKTGETPLRIVSNHLTARYVDWARRPDIDQADGAISYSEKGGSRRVYLGFSEASWEFDDRQELAVLFDSIVAWLRHEPRIFKAAWPDGYLAAQLVEMDTEDKFTNAESLARDLAAINAKGTFYCLTSIAMRYPEVVKSLSLRNEIGYHGDVHVGFRGKAPEVQEHRVTDMIAQMRGIVGDSALAGITGFRAPTESFDATTDRVLRQHGLRYNVSDPQVTEARLPFFSSAEPALGPEQAIVVLPRTQQDDLNYRASKFPLALTQRMILKEFDYVLEMGALGLLSVHSQNYAPDGLMTKLMPAYLERVQENRQKVWITSGAEIADWWRARESVALKSPSPNSQSFEFSTPRPVRGLTIVVTHPYAGQGPKEIRPLAPNYPKPRLKQIDAFRSAAIFDRTEAGHYAYQVLF